MPTLGLQQTRGSYKALTALFNVPPTEHTRLLTLLQEHDCLPLPQPFRARTDDAVTPSTQRKAAV